MNAVRWPVVTALVLCSLGCRSKPAAVPIAPEPKRTPIQQIEPLTEVAAPADLVLVGRINAPSRIVDTVTTWAGFPFDWRTLVAKEMPGVDQVVVMDAPLDVAAMLDSAPSIEPRVHVAFSVGVSSVDQAVSFFREHADVTRRPKTRIRLGQLSCVVERAFGAAPARLICGGEDEDADALAPYMARGLPKQTFGDADLHIHFDAAPIKRRFGAQLTMLKTAGVPFIMKELAVDNAAFDTALRDVLYDGVEEVIDVINDLDRAAVNITVDAQHDVVNATASMKFNGQKSWVAQTLVAAAAKSGPPPEAFWSLPKDSLAATFSLYADSNRFEKPVTAVANLLAGWLEYMGAPEKQRKSLVEASKRAMLAYGPSFYAELPPPPLTTNETDEKRQAREELRRAIGQHLLAIDSDAAPFKAFLSAGVTMFSDKAFRARLAKEKMFEKRPVPTLRQRQGKLAKGLPADTAVFEIEIPTEPVAAEPAKQTAGKAAGKKAAPKKPVAVEVVRAVIIVVPDGHRTWILAGTDEPALYARLAAVRAGSGESLKNAAGLEPLRSAKAVSGGFMTLASFIDSLSSPFDDAKKLGPAYKRNVQLGQVMAAMPHRGLAPMPYLFTADSNGPVVAASLQLPKLVIVDIAAGAAAGLAQQLDF